MFLFGKGFSMYVRSFLKWAGSKYNCLDDIFKRVPREGDLLVEPFVGSATVALNTNYKHYVLCDLNPDVINLYKFVENPSYFRTLFSSNKYMLNSV